MQNSRRAGKPAGRKPEKQGLTGLFTKGKNIPTTAQQTLPYREMYRDGVCRVTDRYYTKTIEYEDINYQLAQSEDQAAMEEATKYIGWPYVWGGSSPSTSFDCSGFVCWVYTASGVHNLPRTTAQGIYNQCAIISPSEAKPGDIIFFTGTYDSPGPVSHVGIYVGDGMMLHCGSPIQYANINSSYWQTHFYAFGRL